jgi:PAS domain S-box-containing protein
MKDEKELEKEAEDLEEDMYSRRVNDWRRARLEMRRVRKEMKRRRKANQPPLHLLFWGLMFILWAVLIFLYEKQLLVSHDLWKGFVAGLGIIFLIQAAVYAFNPETRTRTIGRLIPGFILTFIGLGFFFNLGAWWPVMLAVAGATVILVSLFLQREMQKRRVTQETLRESEVKYHNIIDNASSIIMEIDTGEKITFINKFALGFFGFQENEILGRNIIGSIALSDASTKQEQEIMLADISEHPENYLHLEKENQRKNGEKVWIIWTYKPVLDEQGDLKEILCIGIDSTLQKKADELAEQQIKEQTTQEERTRLARDLHDAVSQTLFSASLIADVLPKVWERNEEEGHKKLEEVRQLTRGALAEMRTLLFELRPAALVDADLHDLLRQLAESVTGRARIPVALEVEGECEIPPDIKVAFYRIAQEALNNIAKHSGAGRAQVALHCRPDGVELSIIDNGHGFDTAQETAGSFGLGNMKERANGIAALLKINSKPGEGTEVSVTWSDHKEEVPR